MVSLVKYRYNIEEKHKKRRKCDMIDQSLKEMAYNRNHSFLRKAAPTKKQYLKICNSSSHFFGFILHAYTVP